MDLIKSTTILLGTEFVFHLRHVRKLPLTIGWSFSFLGYSGFNHQPVIACHDLPKNLSIVDNRHNSFLFLSPSRPRALSIKGSVVLARYLWLKNTKKRTLYFLTTSTSQALKAIYSYVVHARVVSLNAP